MNFQQGLTRKRTPAFESYWKIATAPKAPVELISDAYVLATLQYAMDPNHATINHECSGEPFIIPSWKEVQQSIHDSPPISMPDEHADRDEVRRFLYMILTYRKNEASKGTPLAVSHPVAIIAAVERWHHGGHALNVVTGPDWFTDSFLRGLAADIQMTIGKILWFSVSHFLMKKSGWMVYPWLRTPKVEAEVHLVRAFSRHQRKTSLSDRHRKRLKDANSKMVKAENSRAHGREKGKEHEVGRSKQPKERESRDADLERRDSMQPSWRVRPANLSTFSRLKASEYAVQRERAVQASLPVRNFEGVDVTNTGYPYRYVTNFEAVKDEDEILPALSDDVELVKLTRFERIVEHMMSLRPGNRNGFRPQIQEQQTVPTYDSVPSIWNNLDDGLKSKKSGRNSSIPSSRHRRQNTHQKSNSLTSIRKAFHKVARRQKASDPSATSVQQPLGSLTEPRATNVRPKESFWSKCSSFVLPGSFRRRG
jgi:hypothetical protein